MRVAHRMQRNEGAGGWPRNLIHFDVETVNQPAPGSPSTPELLMGAAQWVQLDRDRSEEWVEFTSADTFWGMVDRRARRRNTLYAIAHNVFFDASVLRFEESLLALGWKPDLRSSVLPTDGPGPTWSTWREGERKLVLLNLGNFFPGRLETIGDAIGFPKGLTDIPESHKLALLERARNDPQAWEQVREYLLQDVRIVGAAFRFWVEFCRGQDLGHFALSLAGQALQAFRHRFMSHDIYHHNDERITRLERDAYFGGLSNIAYRGRWDGEVRTHDINSQYPTVMEVGKVPTRLIARARSMAVPELERKLAAGALVVSRLELDITKEEDAVFPLLHQGKLLTPMGRHWFTLNTPEVIEALRRGVVQHVGQTAFYQGEVVFRDYVHFFYELRLSYKRDGNETMAYICKLFLNSLYGKFGQHSYQWNPSPLAPEGKAGTSRYQNHAGEVFHVRELGGDVQVRAPARSEGYHSFCAISGHITSYARLLLRQYLEAAGEHGVLAYDTDSVIATAAGAERLSTFVDPSRLGALKIEDKKSGPGGVFWGPKDYQVDGHPRVLKGVRPEAVPVEDPDGLGRRAFQQVRFRGIAGAFRDRDVNHAQLSVVVKVMAAQYSKGEVDPSGWVHPLRL